VTEERISAKDFLARLENYRKASFAMMHEGHKLGMMARRMDVEWPTAIDHTLTRIDLDWCFLAKEVEELLKR
jgi:hypothetical protein